MTQEPAPAQPKPPVPARVRGGGRTASPIIAGMNAPDAERTPPTPDTPRDAQSAPPDTRERLKRAAQRLFAQRGFDGVAVRDIVAASGQRNAASVHYYFGTKEALAQELVADGARCIDAVRNAALDAMQARGHDPTLREAVDLLVRSSFVPPPPGEEASFLQFIAMLRINHRELFLAGVGERWNRGFKRLLNQLRRLLPQLPAPVLSQRLVFLSVYLGEVLAAREAALAAPGRRGAFWRQPLALENLVDTVVGLLQAPISAPAQAALGGTAAARSRAGGARRP